MFFDVEEFDSEERARNRRAAMRMAQDAAMRGDPVAGSLFGFLHSIRSDPNGAFPDDFYEYIDDDDSDLIRPY